MIYARLYKHLTVNNILTLNQFGFRTDYYVEQAIFSLIIVSWKQWTKTGAYPEGGTRKQTKQKIQIN
jgi:hypothetical protein